MESFSKLRHKTCIGMIEKYMKLGSKDLLDIGCALGDFTGKLYNVNKENRFLLRIYLKMLLMK